MDATPQGVTTLFSTLTGASFLDASHAWIMVSGAQAGEGVLYRTTDGGLTWASSPVPFPGGTLQIRDGLNGHVLVDQGYAAGSQAVAIYETTDGGITWGRAYTNAPQEPGASDSLPFTGQKSGITFVDSLRGWASGHVPMEGSIYLYSTQDGGITWTKQDPLMPDNFPTAMTEAYPPHFFGAQEGILPVRLLAGIPSFVFYVTHDAGSTWTPTFALNFSGGYSVASLLDLFLWDGGTRLYVSHDSGLTWGSVSTNVNVQDTLVHFEFVDARNGWALTRDAAGHASLLRSVDGGVMWTALIP
jgi:photosystem II stability/assembly factor-like uncharacterized protein